MSPSFIPAAQEQSQEQAQQGLKTQGRVRLREACFWWPERLESLLGLGSAQPSHPGGVGLDCSPPNPWSSLLSLDALHDLAPWTMDGILQSWMGSLPKDGQNPWAPQLSPPYSETHY